MTLTSLSTKLYLGITVAALVAWVAGVPGRTILSLAAVGLMIAMHAGGHGHGHGGGGGGHEDRDPADSRARRTGGNGPAVSTQVAGQDPALRTQPRSAARGCH